MTRAISAILAGALLLWPAAVLAQDRVSPRFTVVRTLASPSTDEKQLALLVRVGPGFEGPVSFWVAERRIAWRRMGERGVIREWVDGRDCPALARVVAGVQRLPPVRFAGPETPARFTPFHHPLTTLHGPPAAGGGDGAVRVARSDYQGGVARWWLDAERDLAGCWRKTPPEIGGAALDLLATPEAADRFANPVW